GEDGLGGTGSSTPSSYRSQGAEGRSSGTGQASGPPAHFPTWILHVAAIVTTEGAADLGIAVASRVLGPLVRAGRTGVMFAKAYSTWNRANHLFGPKSLVRHGLSGVLKAFGGDAVAAQTALEVAAQEAYSQGALKVVEGGVFRGTVTVGGETVTVTGRV